MAVTIQPRDIFIAHGWEKSQHIHKITELLDRATDFDDQFTYINHGEVDPSALNEQEFGNREFEVQNQIKKAGVVIVLSDLYNEHQEWVDKEIEMAVKMDIPVIVIRSDENRETPPHLEELADESVFFDPEEILKMIKNYG